MNTVLVRSQFRKTEAVRSVSVKSASLMVQSLNVVFLTFFLIKVE